jgi:hypothetical protein
LDLCNRGPLVNRPSIPEEDDVTPQVAQQPPQKGCHMHRGKVGWLKRDIQPHVLALGRHGEGGQRRDAIVFVAVEDDGRLSRRRPGPTTRGDEQKAALIEEREMGAKSSGFFLWPATCSASNAQSLVRRAGWPGVPAPDSSNASFARPSTRARGDSAPGTPTIASWPCASRSRARGESRRPWPLSARVAAMVDIVGPRACTANPVPAWRPRPPRRRSPKPAATATLILPCLHSAHDLTQAQPLR